MTIVGRSIGDIQVGQTASFVRTFAESDVRSFADLTRDHNPFHTDPEFARRTRFGRPIVHGLLTASAFAHFGGDLFPGPGILATRVEMEFLRPVYAGEPVTSTAEVVAVDRARGTIVFVTTCRNAAGEVVATIRCEGRPTAIDTAETAPAQRR